MGLLSVCAENQVNGDDFFLRHLGPNHHTFDCDKIDESITLEAISAGFSFDLTYFHLFLSKISRIFSHLLHTNCYHF